LEELEEREHSRVMQKLKQEAEILKKKLSATNSATVKITPLLIYDSIPMNLNLQVTKEDFEALIKDHIDRSRQIIAEALKRANITEEEISKVILVGGSTLIPMVKRVIAGHIKEPYRASDPAKSVAMGAAIYNYLIHLPNSNIQIKQITRQIIGTEAIIEEATMKKGLIPIIPMGTEIPAIISDDKFKALKDARAVRVDVYQWEEGFEADRKYIGSLTLEGIEKQANLKISYSINENNIFEVSVMDKISEKSISAELDRSKNLPKLPEKTYEPEIKGMNIVFLIDTTGSMDVYIEGVKEKAIEFSKILKDKDIDFQLGLIGFGDLLEKEKPRVYRFTKDIEKFKKNVIKLKRYYGGDLPESSLDALETGMEHLKKSRLEEENKNVFILITDAPPHIPTESGNNVLDIEEQLRENNIVLYVVARRDKESIEAYEPLTDGAKRYYSMEESFNTILDTIAYNISELVRI